jgi:hypothetical protein
VKQVTVHIATTDGPAEVQRLTAEDPEVRSVVCLGGKAVALPISADYDAFVRKPTGVIEAYFGHGAWRIDLARPISGGMSWQLGAFIAHALAEAGRLAAPDDRVKLALWVSGEVDRDLAVGAVRDIGLKLDQSRDTLTRLRADGVAILIAVPAANAAEAEAGVQAIFGADATDIEIVAAGTVNDVLAALRLPFRKRRRLWSKRSSARYPHRGRRKYGALVGAVAVAVVMVALAGWNRGGEAQPPSAAPPRAMQAASATAPARATAIATGATVSRAPTGASCAQVHFGVRPASVEEWPVAGTGELPALKLAGLCDLSYRITNSSAEDRFVWVFAARIDAAGGFRSRVLHRAKRLAAGQSLHLDAMPPRRLDATLRQDFAVVVTSPGVKATDAGLQKAVMAADAVRTRPDWDRLLQRAAEAGAAVHHIRQEFRP